MAISAEHRRRFIDSKKVVVMTAPAGADRHVHCAQMDGRGFGLTSAGPDGHVHQVDGCDVLESAGHSHELSATRCRQEHDRHVRHVE